MGATTAMTVWSPASSVAERSPVSNGFVGGGGDDGGIASQTEVAARPRAAALVHHIDEIVHHRSAAIAAAHRRWVVGDGRSHRRNRGRPRKAEGVELGPAYTSGMKTSEK